MHEAQGEGLRSFLLNGAQVGAVHVDGVVLSSGKEAVEHAHAAAASGEVHKVGRRSQDAAALFARAALNALHGDVARVLAHDAQPVQIVHAEVFESDVTALVDEHAHLVADDVAHGERVAHLGQELLGRGEADHAGRHFAGLRRSQRVPSATVEEAVVVRIIFNTVVAVRPPALAKKMDAAVGYLVARIAMELHGDGVGFDALISEFRTAWALKVGVEIAQRNVAAVVEGNHGHLAVEHEGGAVAFDGEVSQVFQVDADGLDLRRAFFLARSVGNEELLADGSLAPEVVATGAEGQHFGALLLAGAERFLHFDGLVLVSVRQNAELLGMDGVGRRRLGGSTQKDCHEGKEKDLLLSAKTLKCTIYYPGALINRTSGYSFPQSKPP